MNKLSRKVNLIFTNFTSFVLGLGVFGFVDVTGDGTAAVGVLCGFACFNAVGDFNAILNEFSFIRPFVQNCIDSGC